MKEGDGYADDFNKEDVFLKSPRALKEMIEKKNAETREKYEHLDLDGKEQEDYAEHHQAPWYKRIIN
jgi:hypothetical protein